MPPGEAPHKRHTQHRAPDGSLYAEELFGVEGFTGRSSLLYHLRRRRGPTGSSRSREIWLEEADDGAHHHRLIEAAGSSRRATRSAGGSRCSSTATS